MYSLASVRRGGAKDLECRTWSAGRRVCALSYNRYIHQHKVEQQLNPMFLASNFLAV